MAAAKGSQAGGLVKKPVRVRAVHRGETLLDQVFQTTPIRIGRLLDNDIVLPFDFVSRYHCEIRFIDTQWTAVDLGSKNGLLLDANTPMHEIALSDGDQFRIQEVTLHLTFEKAEDIVHDFHALRDAATVIGDIEDLKEEKTLQPLRKVTKTPAHNSANAPSKEPAPARAQTSGKSKSAKSTRAKPTSPPPSNTPPAADAAFVRDVISSEPSISVVAKPQAKQLATPTGKRPLLDVDINQLIYADHPHALQAKERAVQMVVVWYDQVIDAYEVPVGDTLVWDFLGDEIDLGYVGADKTQIVIPEGCSPLRGDAGPRSMNVSVHETAAFRAGPNLTVTFRYVPKSKDLARDLSWIEEKLVDPLIFSSAVHGTAAVAAMFLGHKTQTEPVREEPERFATILVAPTPPPVALQPTPTPTPPPTPTPLIAKEEPPKPEKPKVMPTPKVVKVVVKEKKKRPPSIARKEEIAPPKVVAPIPVREPPKVVAKVEPPPKPEPPAPTPVPFNAKSVGALKAFSSLSIGPNTNIANVEKIQVSRAPASVSGSMIGREAVSGTGEIISKLSQSATGNGIGKGDPTGVALGGKTAGGKYGSKGLGGKAGTRNIRGTVIGGATYSELTKNEGLTREQVMKEVQKHQAQIQACYEKSLMSNPDIVGRADFEWEITPKGSVTTVSVKEATIKNGENLLECVKGVFARMKFPEAKNGEATTPTIGLPFGRL